MIGWMWHKVFTKNGTSPNCLACHWWEARSGQMPSQIGFIIFQLSPNIQYRPVGDVWRGLLFHFRRYWELEEAMTLEFFFNQSSRWHAKEQFISTRTGPLPCSDKQCPFVIIGDEGFPLKPYLMRPYASKQTAESFEKRIFNYRLCRARRIIENCFGILVARWRIFLKPIEAHPKNADKYVKCAIVLHNYLMKSEERKTYVPSVLVDQDDGKGWYFGRMERVRVPTADGHSSTTRY